MLCREDATRRDLASRVPGLPTLWSSTTLTSRMWNLLVCLQSSLKFVLFFSQTKRSNVLTGSSWPVRRRAFFSCLPTRSSWLTRPSAHSWTNMLRYALSLNFFETYRWLSYQYILWDLRRWLFAGWGCFLCWLCWGTPQALRIGVSDVLIPVPYVHHCDDNLLVRHPTKLIHPHLVWFQIRWGHWGLLLICVWCLKSKEDEDQ